MLTHLSYIPTFFTTILEDAFQPSPLIGGTVMFTIITGIKRGVFSNEAGMGSGAHAAATTDSEFPIEQGYIQAFGVYVTTLFICTITAFLIMVTDAISVADNYSNGIELTQYALTDVYKRQLYMSLIACICVFLLGLIIGLILFLTGPNQLLENKWINRILSAFVLSLIHIFK